MPRREPDHKAGQTAERQRRPEQAARVPRELLDGILEELLRREAEISQSINYELEEIKSEEKEKHHPADLDELGGDAGDEETNMKILEIESAELTQIEWALARIREGLFGICEECDQPIGEDRLRALVFATSCIECKRAQELAERAEETAWPPASGTF